MAWGIQHPHFLVAVSALGSYTSMYITINNTQKGCSQVYVDHRYVFTIYSTVEDLGGLRGHMVMIEGTGNGSLFQVCIMTF